MNFREQILFFFSFDLFLHVKLYPWLYHDFENTLYTRTVINIRIVNIEAIITL